MSKIQTSQEKENKRARAMVFDIVEMVKKCNNATEKQSCWDKDFDYENDWKKPFIVELDRLVKERLFETSERSWTMNDIYVFLNCLLNELEQKDRATECFYKIMKKHSNGNCFDVDFRLCPFGLLYQAFLELVFENANLIYFVSRRILEAEAKKQAEAEARLKEEAESIVREVKNIVREAKNIVREAKAKTEITEDEKWQAINEQNWETAMNEARAEMEVIA